MPTGPADTFEDLRTVLADPAMTADPETLYLASMALGLSANAVGRWEDAVEALTLATQIQGDDAHILIELGKALYALGREDEARKVWLQALHLKPEDRYTARLLESVQCRPKPHSS